MNLKQPKGFNLEPDFMIQFTCFRNLELVGIYLDSIHR